MRITVLQWNVWFKENIERVLDELKKHDADIICLQELTKGYIEQSCENTWEFLGHELGLHYRVQEIPIFTPDSEWTQANAIFSRFEITDKKTAWLHLPKSEEDLGDQYRGYLEASVDVGNTPLRVATTHMSFNRDPASDHELHRLLKHIGSNPERFVLAGDLNATPESTRIAGLGKHLEHAGPPFDRPTWTTKTFHFPEYSASSLDWRYDYVFTSRDITAVDARTINTHVSDHLPILITLEI